MSREALEEQRQDLVAKLRHAELLHSHSPCRDTAQRITTIRSALSRLADVATAHRHRMLSVRQRFEPSTDNLFVTEEELAARKGLRQHKKVVYL